MPRSQDGPDQDAILRGIDAQLCPWCGQGPFAMLPVHTNKAHGIDKWALRDLAGLSTNDSLCSAEVLDKMSENAKANGHVEKATAASRGRHRSGYRRTLEGRRRNMDNLQTWSDENPELHRQAAIKASASVTPEGLKRRRQALIGRPMSDNARRALQDPAVAERRKAAARATRAAKALPCGTRASYRRGCRCEKCASANREYRRLHG